MLLRFDEGTPLLLIPAVVVSGVTAAARLAKVATADAAA